MQKAPASNGYFMCFMLNLFLNFRWGALALGLMILHLWIGIPLYVPLAGFCIWIFVALFATWLVAFGLKSSEGKMLLRKNKNPYSAKEADVFHLSQKRAKDHVSDEE